MLKIKIQYSNGGVLYATLANPTLHDVAATIGETSVKGITITEIVILGWHP